MLLDVTVACDIEKTKSGKVMLLSPCAYFWDVVYFKAYNSQELRVITFSDIDICCWTKKMRLFANNSEYDRVS